MPSWHILLCYRYKYRDTSYDNYIWAPHMTQICLSFTSVTINTIVMDSASCACYLSLCVVNKQIKHIIISLKNLPILYHRGDRET